jgi:predicted metal-binding protein
MNTHQNHKITVCTSCKHKGTECRPGFALIKKLRATINAAGNAIPEDFEVSGVACMAGCDRPCMVAYHGSRKATYLLGDIDPAVDIDDLVTFAQQYAYLHDGWCSLVDRPGRLRKHTLARAPSAIIALETSNVRAS